MPVGPSEYECATVFHLPLEKFWFKTPPRIEMYVFNAADIVNFVDENTAIERLAVDIANERAFVA